MIMKPWCRDLLAGNLKGLSMIPIYSNHDRFYSNTFFKMICMTPYINKVKIRNLYIYLCIIID